MHNSDMRTSITLDEDVYQLAFLYAKGRGTTLSAAINELVRKAEAAPRSASDSSPIKIAPNGLLVFASRGRILTPEMVRAAQEDEID
jgi:hypothetical protein